MLPGRLFGKEQSGIYGYVEEEVLRQYTNELAQAENPKLLYTGSSKIGLLSFSKEHCSQPRPT